jgi:citrate synthase
MEEFAEIKVEGKSVKLPVITGTENEKAIDIAKLRSETGYITLDYGYKNTGATQSSITYLDGENGILRYRGYSIEELAEKSNFLEVAYLLIYGALPTASELANFEKSLAADINVDERVKNLLAAFPSKAHPMAVLSAAIGALSTFEVDSQNPNRSKEEVLKTIISLTAKMPTLSAWAYKNFNGEACVNPKVGLGYIENFIYMMFGKDADPVIVDAINKLLILHADHEQNCSTSTVRIVGSSNANLFSSISAGVSALWGPLHGGANQAVIEMLEAIRDSGTPLSVWIDKAKDKNDPFRLMGFGHRVYKSFDPRATIIKKAADDVLEKLGIQDPLIDIAKQLEQVALSDEYFKARNLYPNVDFYSGIIYKALGIPTEMFTVMFALGRLPGWIAQWKEMTENKEPIGRPRQVYTGANNRPYVAISNR